MATTAHHFSMSRLRALAAVLGCLAVLASGVMTVAAAAAPASASVPERSSAGAPCSHCHDCNGVPCPIPSASCLQAASNASPTLATAAVDLPIVESGQPLWSLGAAVLNGLSPPPDPFPPRA